MTQPEFKLSICIATFNRAAFIGATLDSIICQTTNECEIVVSDNASTDNTQQVVAEFARRFSDLRYFSQEKNIGMDRNLDRAVELARGEYCWLFTDDDLMKPGALARVLEALRRDLSLIVVNVESRDFSMTKVLQHRWIEMGSDRVYGPDEMDCLFVEMDDASRVYIGNRIFRRTIWLAHDRHRYYDSLFIQVGAIFQQRLPGAALLIADSLVSYRLGNETTYSPQRIEMMFSKWPAVVESLAFSEAAKNKIISAAPWNNPQWLLFLRGWGRYSMTEYRRWVRPRLHSVSDKLTCTLVALLPGSLINLLFVIYYVAHGNRGHLLYLIRQSPFYPQYLRLSQRRNVGRPVLTRD